MNTIKKYKFAILKNEDPFDHINWVNACSNYKDRIDFQVFDITGDTFFNQIIQYKPDFCLLKPSGKTSLFRQLYLEKVEILVRDLNLKIYPSYDEIRIYENKRYFAYWAKVNNIPHPKTNVYYHKNEVLENMNIFNYPIVGKLNIGASGKGIQFLNSKHELLDYVEKAFSEGLKSKTGPKIKNGKLLQRFFYMLFHPSKLRNRLQTYKDIANDIQKGFLLLQENIEHEFEWRAVRIGDSFFAHKKMKMNEKASGSLLKNYDNPPLELFNFVKELTDKFNFKSVAVDIF